MTSQIFFPLIKADAVQRLVFGRIDETPDRAGEVFDYASSKPEFMKWSDDVNKATDGKSLGNVRAMHGNIAAGRLDGIVFDDVQKSINITAHIVDDAEWAKVLAGVYTGFSPGGSYLKRWKDGAHTRYTARPSEISIVDLPCIPSASFTLTKADGLEEQVLFKAGARHSKEDSNHLQAIHDHAVGMGATCSGGGADDANKSAQTGDLAKAAEREGAQSLIGGGADDLAKMQIDLTQARDALAKAAAESDALKKKITELQAQPTDDGPRLRVVEKGVDLSSTQSEPADPMTKINAMPPGPAKQEALRKFAQETAAAETDAQ